MKNALRALLGAALLSVPSFGAFAADRVVSVTFASVAALQAKNGDRLDPKLFRFGKSSGWDDTAHGASNGMGRHKEAACRWALLAAFLKFQHKAQDQGKHVVDVRTYAGDRESSKADACLCLAGGFVVRSTVKALYR